MDVLKAQLARMQQQLTQLSASQKMLAISLVALMVLTLLFWGRYAGSADMEAVLEQPLKPEEITRITGQIRSKGIDYKVIDGRIMVPADRKLDVLADLSYMQLVPSDTQSAYDEILKRVNPWSSSADNDATRNDAKAALLAHVIRKFPGVASADVIIDPTNERRLGGGGRQPTAIIIITMRDPSQTKIDRQLINGAAMTVVGAQSGLMMSNVKVVVNGKPCTVSDQNSIASLSNSDEMLTKQQESEQYFTQKISQHLTWAGAVIVAVTCDVNIKSEQRTEETYDPKGVVQKELSTESETNEQSEPPPPVGEPGAIPNSPLAVGAPSSGSSGSAGSTKERNSTKFENKFGKTISEQIIPAGKTRVLAATVRIPRSFLVWVYKQSNPQAQSEPDATVIAQVLQEQAESVRRDIKSCTAIANEGDIVVDMYPDGLPLMGAVGTTAIAGTRGTSSNFTAMLTGHYKEIGIAMLALVSLFMVSSMVKKSTPAPVMTVINEPTEPEVLMAGEDVHGEATEGNATLDGMELDDDAVKAQQMVEQVATMVKENPDGAANLVKRWLNRT